MSLSHLVIIMGKLDVVNVDDDVDDDFDLQYEIFIPTSIDNVVLCFELIRIYDNDSNKNNILLLILQFDKIYWLILWGSS